MMEVDHNTSLDAIGDGIYYGQIETGTLREWVQYHIVAQTQFKHDPLSLYTFRELADFSDEVGDCEGGEIIRSYYMNEYCIELFVNTISMSQTDWKKVEPYIDWDSVVDTIKHDYTQTRFQGQIMWTLANY